MQPTRPGGHARPRLLLASLCCLNAAAVSSLYWAQAVTPLARAAFEGSRWASLMPSASLAGYAVGVAGLAGVVRDMTTPAGLAGHLCVLGLGLVLAVVAPSAPSLLALCFVVGVGCSLTQRILATAASAVAPSERGPVIGYVVASGLAGIVVARAVVPLAAADLGWRAMFLADACFVVVAGLSAVEVRRRAPPLWSPVVGRDPVDTVPGAFALWSTLPGLRRAALLQGAVFAVFNGAWAVLPRMSDSGGLFGAWLLGCVAVAGVASALCAGQAIRRWRPAFLARLGAAVVGVGLAAGFLVAALVGHGAVWLVVLVLVDVGTQVALVSNQSDAQAVATSPAMRGRLAAIVTTVGFLLGAVGAAVGNAL